MVGSRKDPESWKLHVHEIGQQWAAMSKSEREPWISKAADEQKLRECASYEPHESKAEANAETYPGKDDRVSNVLSAKSKKLLSRHQTLASYERFVNAAEWKCHDAGLCSAVGALDLDNINMDLTEDAIDDQRGTFSKPHGELPREWVLEMERQKAAFKEIIEDDGNCHNPCHAEFGMCRSSPWMSLVTKYVHCMSDLVNTGPLAVRSH